MADNPYTAFNFLVEIEGVTVGGFAECSGLTTETAVIKYRNGDEDTMRKLPGLRKYGNVVLKRGLTQNAELWLWRKQVIEGRTERRAGSIVLLNEAREEVLRWNFREGWPSEWEGPELSSKANEVAIETLEIAVEHIELAS